MSFDSTVFIVDDDEAVRDAIGFLMKSVGLPHQLYVDGQEFLAAYEREPSAGCLVLDIRMPKLNGLELQERLNKKRLLLPIIFITGHGDVPMAVQAMQHGAFDFLQKPFRDQDLLDRVQSAIEQDKESRDCLLEQGEIMRRLATLTEREREIFDRVVEGQANKVIAIDLGLSQRTIEIHRSHVMEKLQAGSLANLVRMCEKVKPS